VGLAHLDAVTDRAVLGFHVVAAVLIAAFAALSWDEMETDVLRIWRDILLVGLLLTVGGVVGLLYSPLRDPFLTTTILGWMVVPGLGLYYTGKRVSTGQRAYTVGAALSVVGAAVYAGALFPAAESALLVGIALAMVGQTAGIAQAVRQPGETASG
jgi:orotidine-5'-phosphate decarboxylase